MISFCNLIHTLNHNTCSILQDFIPIIPERTMFEINSPEKNEIQNLIANTENIQKILSVFYPEETKENKIHLTFGGDPASVKLIPESGKTAVYFILQFLKKKKKNQCQYAYAQTNNGLSNKIIVEKLDEISD